MPLEWPLKSHLLGELGACGPGRELWYVRRLLGLGFIRRFMIGRQADSYYTNQLAVIILLFTIAICPIWTHRRVADGSS